MLNTVEEPSYIANKEIEISHPAILTLSALNEDITDRAICQKYPQKRFAESFDEHLCKKKKVDKNICSQCHRKTNIYFRENYNSKKFSQNFLVTGRGSGSCGKKNNSCNYENNIGNKLFTSSNIFLEIQNDNLNEVIKLYNLQSYSMNKIYTETNGQTLLQYSIIKKAKLVSDWFLQNEVTDLFKKKYL